MNEDRETQIRERAYRLWQADGSPDGRADEYWHQAERQLDAEGGASADNGAADGADHGATDGVDDGAEPAADLPIAQSAKRRIPGEPLEDTDAIPKSEIAHERRRTR
ncbi:DUF2934 domain-containing protein [Burkholderia latens]|uniref:DUF2934 domain-containing protein n=1 Tax=Burkholderia latens TaxID=488446 RepID=UPI00158D90AA|nr:DUF2934 domain-containing protein [Burkholderia latens]